MGKHPIKKAMGLSSLEEAMGVRENFVRRVRGVFFRRTSAPKEKAWESS